MFSTLLNATYISRTTDRTTSLRLFSAVRWYSILLEQYIQGNMQFKEGQPLLQFFGCCITMCYINYENILECMEKKKRKQKEQGNSRYLWNKLIINILILCGWFLLNSSVYHKCWLGWQLNFPAERGGYFHTCMLSKLCESILIHAQHLITVSNNTFTHIVPVRCKFPQVFKFLIPVSKGKKRWI